MPCWVQRAQGLSGSPHEPQGCAAPLGAENHPELDEGPASVLRWFPDTFHDFRVASVSHFRVYQPHQTRRGTLLWLFYFPLILSVWGPGPPWWGSGSTRVQAPEAEMQSKVCGRGPPRGAAPAPRFSGAQAPGWSRKLPDLTWPGPAWGGQCGFSNWMTLWGGGHALMGPEGWHLSWGEGQGQPCWLVLVAPGHSWPHITPPHTPVCSRSALGDPWLHLIRIEFSQGDQLSGFQAGATANAQPCARWLRPPAV